MSQHPTSPRGNAIETSDITASQRSNESYSSRSRGDDHSSTRSHRSSRHRQEQDTQSEVSSNDSSTLSSPSNRRHHHQYRPRFDSKASWADSTRLDMGERSSDVSVKDLRLTNLSGNRLRSDSRASSRLSSRSRTSSVGITRHRKDSQALSTITEHWNLLDEQFNSPFSDFNTQGRDNRIPIWYDSNICVIEQPVQDQLQRGLDIINEHSVCMNQN